jgi:hypothetical protein
MRAVAQGRPRRLQVVTGGEGGVTRGAERLPDIGRVGVVALGAAEAPIGNGRGPESPSAAPGLAGTAVVAHAERSTYRARFSFSVYFSKSWVWRLRRSTRTPSIHIASTWEVISRGSPSVMITVADFPGVIDP